MAVQDLFTTCSHGMRILERRPDFDVDEPNWLIQATVPEDRASIQNVLDKFNRITTVDTL